MQNDDETSRGFGFINFENPDSAQAAVSALNGKEMEDKELYVGRAQKKSEREAALKQRYVFCVQLGWRMLYWALLKSHLHISASTTSVCIVTALVARKLNGCMLHSFNNNYCCHSCIGCINLPVAWYMSNACILHHLLSATDGYASGLMRRGGIEGRNTRA